MALQTNPQLELAYEYVCYTNKNIFLTGKAGTGKTTFLHRVKEEVIKRMAVVAPTGVAAINAGGMTIHSLFQLPFGPYLPGNVREAARQRRFSREKRQLLSSLDLLVIDEISMVRADVLDAIDDVLRRYKNPIRPFGGVQLLMIGDLHQLPPVVKDEEWYLLREHYDTPYFFGSRALQQTRPVVVELKHIFRQSDTSFIGLLNRVRDNALDDEVLTTLNSRYDPTFEPGETDGYITLTTHNASAQAINGQKLEALPGKVATFKAEISGDFPAHAYPTDELLEVKTGAQVMFVKNDPSPEKRYYNGKIGKITRIEDGEIMVQCPGDPAPIGVSAVDWSNMKYSVDEESKEVTEAIIGTFTQVPLRLAWAITIHKSQGLTFERVILDAQAAFAHGQVYVALSRCKSFEGIVLSSQIAYSSVRTDSVVKNYSEAAEKNAPDEADLQRSKLAYQQTLLLELFGFDPLKRRFEKLNRVLLEHESSFQPGAYKPFKLLTVQAEAELLPVAEKFQRQLRGLCAGGALPEENEALQERVRKGCAWFARQLDTVLQPAVEQLSLVTDNREVRRNAQEALDNLKKELFVKKACFAAAAEGFATNRYLKVKAKAELDFQTAQSASAARGDYAPPPKDAAHPELYQQLRHWRERVARKKGVDAYTILPARSLFELAERLPLSKAGLKEISGIGKGRIRNYGADLIRIIERYCRNHDLSSPLEEELKEKKAPKPDTKMQSFVFFRSGKTIEEIAELRGLQPSTIEGHLAHFIGAGELDILELLPEPDVRKIEAFLDENPEAKLSEIKEFFADDFSYGQLKMVLEHRNSQVEEEASKEEGG